MIEINILTPAIIIFIASVLTFITGFGLVSIKK